MSLEEGLEAGEWVTTEKVDLDELDELVETIKEYFTPDKYEVVVINKGEMNEEHPDFKEFITEEWLPKVNKTLEDTCKDIREKN